MDQPTIGVPRLLWESIEVTLWAHARQYVRELARYLAVKEDTLLREVLPTKDTLKVYMQESPTDCPYDLECKALIEGPANNQPGHICAYRCRKTIENGHSFCSKHIYARINVQALMAATPPIPKVIRRIRGPDINEPLWVDERGSVWDYYGVPRGYYDSETRQLRLISQSE
jgi:hypothetical protein